MRIIDGPTYYVYCANRHIENSKLYKIYGDVLNNFGYYKNIYGKPTVQIKHREIDGKTVVTAPSQEVVKKIKKYLNGKYSPNNKELFLIDNNFYRDLKPNENRKSLTLVDSNKYYVYCANIDDLDKKQLFELYKKYYECANVYKGEMCIRSDRKQVFSTPNLKNAKLVKDWLNSAYDNKLVFKIDNSYYRDE